MAHRGFFCEQPMTAMLGNPVPTWFGGTAAEETILGKDMNTFASDQATAHDCGHLS